MIPLVLVLAAMAGEGVYGPELAPVAAAPAAAPLADVPADADTYNRLFADDATAAASGQVETEPTIPGWLWPLGLGAIGIVGAIHLKRQIKGARVENVKVLHRTALGDRSALMLVEVADARGERRRLLIGTGTGAPSLVADLGDVKSDDTVASVEAEFEAHVARAEAAVEAAPVAFAAPVAGPIVPRSAVHLPTPPAMLPPPELKPLPAGRLDIAIGGDDATDAFFGSPVRSSPRGRYFTEQDLAPIAEPVRHESPRIEASRPPPMRVAVAPAARAVADIQAELAMRTPRGVGYSPTPQVRAPKVEAPPMAASRIDSPNFGAAESPRATLKDILTRAAAKDAERRPEGGEPSYLEPIAGGRATADIFGRAHRFDQPAQAVGARR